MTYLPNPKERRLAAIQQEAAQVSKLVWMWRWGEKYQPPTNRHQELNSNSPVTQSVPY
jgi:hypothetical protein